MTVNKMIPCTMGIINSIIAFGLWGLIRLAMVNSILCGALATHKSVTNFICYETAIGSSVSYVGSAFAHTANDSIHGFT